MNKYYTNYYNIGKFIANIGNNWRNSLYVTCRICKHKKEEYCDDLLVSFDENAIPTIIMVKDANMIFGTIIDKSECLAEISNAKFKELYHMYFSKRVSNDKCPMLDIVNKQSSFGK